MVFNKNCKDKNSCKVCIEVPRVYDACVSKLANVNFTSVLSGFTPVNPVQPLSFGRISSRNIAPSISNLSVTYLNNQCGQSRIKCTLTIPIQCEYKDANGISGVAYGTISIPRDTLLCIPNDSIVPYEIKPVVNVVGTIGEFTSNDTIQFQCCMVVLLKIIVPVDIYINTVGCVDFPICCDFSDRACERLFALPIFPQENKDTQ